MPNKFLEIFDMDDSFQIFVISRDIEMVIESNGGGRECWKLGNNASRE